MDDTVLPPLSRSSQPGPPWRAQLWNHEPKWALVHSAPSCQICWSQQWENKCSIWASIACCSLPDLPSLLCFWELQLSSLSALCQQHPKPWSCLQSGLSEQQTWDCTTMVPDLSLLAVNFVHLCSAVCLLLATCTHRKSKPIKKKRIGYKN